MVHEKLGPVKFSAEAEFMSVTEDRLVDELVKQKASTFFVVVILEPYYYTSSVTTVYTLIPLHPNTHN